MAEHIRNREQNSTEEFEPLITHKCSWRVTRFVFTMVLFVLVIGASLGGSILTHYMLDKLQIQGLYDWQNELVQVLVVSIPLGFAVGLLSFDVRAGFVVSVLTISSLYISWEPYLPNYEGTETGVFDFLLGTKVNDSNSYEYIIRELAGMSLWGLTLTFPTGYILYSLEFGPTYALCGGLIGSTFFFAENMEIDLGPLSCVADRCSYYIWGFWIWLVLLIVSINHLCKSLRNVVKRPKQPVLLVCYHWCCYSKLYTAVFETLAFLFTLLLLKALIYFSLVNQSSASKGESMCGLLFNILGLVITQSYRTGKCVHAWSQKRKSKREYRVPITESIRIAPQPPGTDPTPPTYQQVMVTEPHLYQQLGEALNVPQVPTAPLPHVADQQIIANEHNVEAANEPNERTNLFREFQQPPLQQRQRYQLREKRPVLYGCYSCVTFFQKFFYMELLRVVQLLIDLMSGFVTSGVVGVTGVAVVMGWDSPRFV
eukprot:TRINITY_DN6945_c0_g3_i1.p1 TRINITY_DN6945_c0_g3~~TRINITY_DN6945_c0_g3_i1.p1  ORF type:complete len:484 (+),score=82.57 TRINITY_DN6945_c0_g3_i1:32-1483(+)